MHQPKNKFSKSKETQKISKHFLILLAVAEDGRNKKKKRIKKCFEKKKTITKFLKF